MYHKSIRIRLSSQFKTHFDKKIRSNKKLINRFEARVELFKKNPRHPLLRDHKLSGAKRDQRAFSITGDHRVVYLRFTKNIVVFTDIGTHNQVY